jgi:hypothetical protein
LFKTSKIKSVQRHGEDSAAWATFGGDMGLKTPLNGGNATPTLDAGWHERLGTRRTAKNSNTVVLSTACGTTTSMIIAKIRDD